MRCRHLLSRAVPLLTLLALALAPLPKSFGHGGSFRGPNGGVPPDGREPHDPEAPPPPPSDPPSPDGPPTGGEDPKGPDTPQGPGQVPTPGGDGPAPPIQPTPGQGGGGSRTKATLSYDSWRFWWAYNNDEILNFRKKRNRSTTPANPVAAGTADRENRTDPLRPTQREIDTSVLPALLGCISNSQEHEDVKGGAIIAAAKLGSLKLPAMLEPILWNRYTNDRGQRLDFGPQARESAALAYGLVPGLDGAALAEARRVLLAAVADEGLRTRERTWAAVALGLARDRAAVAPLLELLPLRYPDDNVPAGIVVALGLIGDEGARAALEEMFVKGQFRGCELPPRVRPFAGYALGKLGEPAALPAVLQVLGSRKAAAVVQRSAALAAGALAERAPEEARKVAVDALLRTLQRSGVDATTRNFAIASLGRIGTERAILTLLEEAENGPYGARAFAALGLGTHVFFADRAAAEGRGTPLDAELRRKIVGELARLSGRMKDTETRSAFLLARGLVKDMSARDELVQVVSKPGDTTLRGFACVALGLLGDTSDQAKDALYQALAERKNAELRRDAATGLGLLDDAGTVPYLVGELGSASSFAVQGQIVAALGTIGDQRALAPLVQFLSDSTQPAQVRAMAAVGLGLIGDARQVPPLARLSRDYNYRASVSDLDELLYIF